MDMQILPYHQDQDDQHANRFGNGCTALLSGGAYSRLLKATKKLSIRRNRRHEDESSSNFDDALVGDPFEIGTTPGWYRTTCKGSAGDVKKVGDQGLEPQTYCV